MPAHTPRTPFFLVLLLSFSLVACFGGKGGGGGGNGGGNGGGGGGPVYTVTVTHQGNFTQGQQNATYTVTLTNIGGNFVSVNGNGFLAFVGEELPSGLTLVSMAGVGWTCSIAPPPPNGPGCTTNVPIAAGASAPPITVTVNVAPNASSPQINQVSYPGSACPICPTVSDSTTITPGGGTVSLIQPGVNPRVVAGSTLTLQATVHPGDNGSGVNWGVQAGDTCTVNPDFTTTSSLGTQGGSASLGTVPMNSTNGAVVTYTAPSVAPAAPNNLFTITAAQAPGTTGPCLVVTALPTKNSLLSFNFGNFAFRFRGFTSTGQTFAIIGRFHADGVGSPDLSTGIMAGLEDVNIAQTGGSSLAFTKVQFTGGYNMDSPSHGTMKFIVSGTPWAASASNPPLTMNFSFTLSLDGSFGGLIETDGSASLEYVGSGDFEFQGNSKNFNTNPGHVVGSYVLSLEGTAGVGAAAVHKGIVGRFDLTATTLTGGTFSSTSDDQSGPMAASSGNYTIDDQPNGHGTFSNTTGTLNGSFYIRGPGSFYALRTDPNVAKANPDAILVGVVRAIAVDINGQTIAFNNNSLNGSFIFTLLGITTNGHSSAAAGHFSGTPGYLAGFMDINDGGAVSSASFTGPVGPNVATFTISPNGRGTMAISLSGVIYNFVFYARAPGVGFLLEQPASDTSNRGRNGNYVAQFVSGSVMAAGANGTYTLSTAVVTAASRNSLAVLSLNGGNANSGSFNGMSYSSVLGSALTTSPVLGTFTVTDTTNGRGTLSVTAPGTIAGNAQLAFEVYDPADAALVGIDNANVNNDPPIISLDE